MRILFSFIGGNGHFEPLVPLARAAVTAGHTVAFAGKHSVAPAVEAAGFPVFPLGNPASGPTERMPLRPVSMEREERDLRVGFADRLARQRASAIEALCTSWQPELVVCDEVDFGAMLAAERHGRPYATVVVIASGAFIRPEVVGAALNGVRADLGLAPDPELQMLERHLVLSPVPPSFRDPRFPLPATAQSFRPPELDAPRSPRPPALQDFDDRPLVYVTLGTVFNVESGDLFGRVLAGVRELPLNIVATVGHALDPAELGPQPPNVRIERYIAQSELLPWCAAVVSHGGSGSILGALAHGLPSLVLPMGADQPLNADRIVALDVGRALDAVLATPADVAAAASDLLRDPRYGLAARRLEAEQRALPPVAAMIPLLEQLVSVSHEP